MRKKLYFKFGYDKGDSRLYIPYSYVDEVEAMFKTRFYFWASEDTGRAKGFEFSFENMNQAIDALSCNGYDIIILSIHHSPQVYK